MKYTKSTRTLLSVVCLVTLIGNLVIRPGAAKAFVGGGQLTFAKQVTVNGSNAISGQTIFDGNRIKVGNLGSAMINLGKLGRVELGANSEMTLSVSENNIGGTLVSGCLAINAPAGEGIEINTPKGKVASAGKQPSSFFLGIKEDTANVYPNMGEIKVTAAGKTEIARPGEMIALATEAGGNTTMRRLPKSKCGEPGVFCACGSASVPSPKTTPSASANNGIGAAGLAALLFTAALGTTAVIFGLTNNDSTNGSGLTCVERDSPFCRPTSPTRP